MTLHKHGCMALVYGRELCNMLMFHYIPNIAHYYAVFLNQVLVNACICIWGQDPLICEHI